MKNNNKIYIWVSDRSKFTGEGNLSNKFISCLRKKYKIIFIKDLKTKRNSFTHKYLVPFYGIFMLWVKYLEGKKTGYINYLPLWNFLIFLILPPRVIIGPITGGSIKNENFSIDSIVRFLFFPIFYYLTNLILLFRYNRLIFSTSLLKKKLFNKVLDKSLLNFVFLFLKKKKRIKKKNYLIIYYKKHATKNYDFLKQILTEKYFTKRKYKFIVVGEFLNEEKIINKGYLSDSKLENLIAKCKYAYASKENLYSLFSIKAINNNAKLITEGLEKNRPEYFQDMFINLNAIRKESSQKKSKKDFVYLNKIKNDFNNFFESL